MKDTHTVFVGIDAGGTSMEVRCQIGSEYREVSQESSNVREVDPVAFAGRIALVVEALAPECADGAPVKLCLGAAGAATSSETVPRRTFANGICAALSARWNQEPSNFLVVSDARIALEAAFQTSRGIVVIVGTGSGCYALDADGALVRAGGWGSRLGDPASGVSLGSRALKQVLADLEVGSLSSFSRIICDGLGMRAPDIESVLDSVYSSSVRLSEIAPSLLSLLERGDSTAETIVRQECCLLAVQCSRLAQRVPEAAQRVALVGGLTGSTRFVSVLGDAMREHLTDAVVKPADRVPVEGALDLALNL